MLKKRTYEAKSLVDKLRRDTMRKNYKQIENHTINGNESICNKLQRYTKFWKLVVGRRH